MDRQRLIFIQLTHWKQSLTPLDSAFEQKLKLGRAMEELAKPLLYEQFKGWTAIAHCDATSDTKKKGKRCVLPNGNVAILPDYHFLSRDQSQSILIDIKSKHAHSYHRKDRQVQQFVDEWELINYQSVAKALGARVFILFHLWPKEARSLLNIPSAIDAGAIIPSEIMLALTKSYPTNDWYYLAEVTTIIQHSRKGFMRDKAGYYFPLGKAIAARSSGVLPPFPLTQRQTA